MTIPEKPVTATVTVRLDDLRLLLQEAEPLLVSKETANRPVVWAIDRLGDAVAKAAYAEGASIAKRFAEACREGRNIDRD